MVHDWSFCPFTKVVGHLQKRGASSFGLFENCFQKQFTIVFKNNIVFEKSNIW